MITDPITENEREQTQAIARAISTASSGAFEAGRRIGILAERARIMTLLDDYWHGEYYGSRMRELLARIEEDEHAEG